MTIETRGSLRQKNTKVLTMLRLARMFVICACTVLPAALEASGQVSAGDKYAYSIQFVPKNKSLIGGELRRKVESYDSISSYLEESVSKLLDARGYHLVAPSDRAAFRLTIDLLRAWETPLENVVAINGLKVPSVGIRVALSITDGTGHLLLRNEYTASTRVRPNLSLSERVVTMATRAADDVVFKIDNDKSVRKALYVSSGTVIAPARSATVDAPAQITDASQPPVSASAQSAPRRVLLPAGTALTLAFDTDINSEQATEGDAVSFTLTEDLRAGDSTVVKAGSKAAGYFYYEKTKGCYPRVWSRREDHGKPHLRITYLSTGDTRVNIRGNEEKKERSIMPAAEILGPVKEKSKECVFEIAKGTQVRAFTDEDVNLLVLH